MKLIFSIFFALIAIGTFAQNVPDYDLIESEVTNPSSKYYYPRLMDRYQKSDTTLTLDDYYRLYYGYTFQENYKPLLKTNYVDSLSSVFSRRTAARGDEFSKIERYAYAILSVEPFNLRDLNVLAYAYQQIGYNDKAKLQNRKLEMLTEVIKSTGDGLKDTSPWHIIYQDHAEDILNLMGVEPGRRILVSSTVEFFACKNTPNRQTKGYYFNYAEIYKRKPDYLDEATKTKRKLDINPIPKNIK